MRFFISIACFLFFGITGVNAVAIKEGRQLDVPVCGGFIGLVCPKDQWCSYPPGATCGIADQFGKCRPRPDFCTEQYIPVCGCNGETYSNACHAAADGTDVAYPGPCREKK